MKKQLSLKNSLFIGSMLFGLFFGAGNLIFPVNLGQQAGSNVFYANLGFLVTAVGLPFLGILAIGISGVRGVQSLSEKVHPLFSKIFTISLYLTIGPFFAMPRLATTSFTIGVEPFLGKQNSTVFLLLFSTAFFSLAWLLSKNPGKILPIVGKYLNPLFLLLLGILLIFVFVNPMGNLSHAPLSEEYQNNAFIEGFKGGYSTLDLLASLAFGIVITTTLKELGIQQRRDIAKSTMKSGIIAVLFMSIIYTALTYAGALSLGKLALSENGGIALAQIANHYLGTIGSLLLALIVGIACLKTTIGLITAFSESIIDLFPKVNYKSACLLSAILPAIFANIGLNALIMLSVPVLMFLYPPAISLTLLVLLEPFTGYKRKIYQTTLLFTSFAAFFDALRACPTEITAQGAVQKILEIGRLLPLSEVGMGWLLPGIIGFFVGMFLDKILKKEN